MCTLTHIRKPSKIRLYTRSQEHKDTKASEVVVQDKGLQAPREHMHADFGVRHFVNRRLAAEGDHGGSVQRDV